MEFFATTVEGIALVSGLEWRALTGTASADKETRKYAKDIDAKLYVDVKNADNVVTCGFLPNENKGELPPKPHSLPVILAGMPGVAPDCVLVIQQGEEATIAALLNGVPAPGFDGHGDLEEVVAAARTFIQLAPQGVTVYGNCEELESEPLELAELLKVSTKMKEARLHGLAISPAVRIGMLAVVFLCVAGAAKYGFDYKENLKKMAAERLANADPDVAYKNAVAPLFQSAIPVTTAVATLREILAPIAVSDGGWDMVGIVCQQNGCTFTWQNVTGTNKTFIVPKQVKNMKYSPKGDIVTYELQYAKPLGTGLNVEKTLTIEEIWRDVIGDFQQLAAIGVERNFSNPEVFGIPAGMMGKPTQPFKEGSYTLNGPWFALESISHLPVASSFDTLAISIDSSKHINFKLTGKYYVQ